MSLWTAHMHQTCIIPGPSTVACRAYRREAVGGGGFYYIDWIIELVERVAYGASVTVAGDVARVVQDVAEVRDLSGVVVGYRAVLGHV